MFNRPTAWGSGILGITLLLLAITPVSYGLIGHGTLSVLLFLFGFGGDGNIGAWWSGMLFLLSAVFALDCSLDVQRTGTERRGWAGLAAALALLSFDEVATVHEFLSGYGHLYLAPLGVLGLSLAGYALTNLRRANVPLRTLLVAFGLLATVPFQEFVQSTFEWNDPWIYGARAFIEEGTEIAAVLLFLTVTSGGLLRLRVRSATFGSLVSRGTPLLWAALVALPFVAVAAYALSWRGPANWFGAALFLGCALLVARGAATRRAPLVLAAAAGLYLLASVGSNFVSINWDPPVFGYPVNLRGAFFGALLLAAPFALGAGQPWSQRLFWFAPAVCTLVGAFALPQPSVIWSTWPMTIGLLCFYIELSAALRLPSAVVAQSRPATLATAVGPQELPTVVNRL